MIKNIVSFVAMYKYARIILSAIYAGTIIFSVYAISYFPAFLSSGENLRKFCNLIVFSPPDLFSSYFRNAINPAIIMACYILYNFILYKLNVLLFQRLRERINDIRIINNRFSLIRFLETKFSNPFLIKDIIYISRSPKRIIDYLSMTFFYICILFMIITSKADPLEKEDLILLCEMSFIFFQAILLAINEGNHFGYEYGGILNYFTRPVEMCKVIETKTYTQNFITIINFIFATITLFILGIKIGEYLFYIILLLSSVSVLQIASLFMSVYFPKKMNYYQVMGALPTSFIAWIVILPLVMTVGGLSFVFLLFLNNLLKVLMAAMLIITIYIYNTNKMKILIACGNCFVKRKEKLIEVVK